MRKSARWSLFAVGLVFVLSACQDSPALLGPSGPEANKGQGKKGGDPPSANQDKIDLGRLIFEDTNLSIRRNQSCQTCHEPGEGFAASAAGGAVVLGSVVEGSVPGRFGDRKPPSAAYATLAPLYSGGNNPTGGNFWDGRATGHELGNPAADQALGPFLNPVEQGLPDEACVVYRVLESDYGALYVTVWGPVSISFPAAAEVEAVCTNEGLSVGDHVNLSPGDRDLVRLAYQRIALSLAAFEGSDQVNRFNSLFDQGRMSSLALEGEKLFSSKGKCQQCHSNKGDRPLFTDFAFHNLGVPKNPANPTYDFHDPDDFDPGLGGFTGLDRHMGTFRTPTTRNVAVGANRTYMHNGALVSLTQVVDFYSTRDVHPVCTDPVVLGDPTRWGSAAFGGANCWPPPEFGRNLDTKNMGKLGLTPNEVLAIVQYMVEMSDQ
jgi:cytochrome c peroxidase